MVAQVIVNSTAKTLNREFHYLVPKEMENQIQIGNRAIVPFGNKSVEEGFVIGLIEKSDFATKEIKSISFGLTKDNINLAKLMSKRYFCNISDCIKLMLPPGTSTKRMENRVKEKTGNFVYLKREKEEIENALQKKIIKSPKQIRILKFLIENDGIYIGDLQNLTDTTRAVIKTLEKNEYVKILQEKIERNPFENKNIERDTPYTLNEEQEEAFNKVSRAIEEQRYQQFLLYGVTGSRKNRNLYATYSKSNSARGNRYYASARNFFNTTNDEPLFG